MLRKPKLKRRGYVERIMKEENKLKNMFLKMETIKQTEYKIILLEEPAPQVKWSVLFKWFLGLKLSKNRSISCDGQLKADNTLPGR